MFMFPSRYRHPAFSAGVGEALGASPGFAAWGLMTGVAMANSGLSLVESLSMALLVYAGSSQLAALPLIAAGAPIWVILTTAACVNLRFMVFSMHLRPFVMHLPLWQRVLTGYLTTDSSYVLFVKRYETPGSDDPSRSEQQAFLAGLCGVVWASWMGACVLGVFIAHTIPLAWGLGFAGILALLGIAYSLASTRMRWVSAAVAGFVAVAAYALPFKLNIVMAIAVAVGVCLWLEPPQARAGGQEPAAS